MWFMPKNIKWSCCYKRYLVETPVCNAPTLRDPKVDCTQFHIRAWKEPGASECSPRSWSHNHQMQIRVSQYTSGFPQHVNRWLRQTALKVCTLGSWKRSFMGMNRKRKQWTNHFIPSLKKLVSWRKVCGML